MRFQPSSPSSRVTDRHLITMVSGDYGDFLKVLRLRSGSTTDNVCARHTEGSQGSKLHLEVNFFSSRGWHAGSSSKYVLRNLLFYWPWKLGKVTYPLCASFSSSVKWEYWSCLPQKAILMTTWDHVYQNDTWYHSKHSVNFSYCNFDIKCS